MGAKFWIIYMLVFANFTLISQIGEAQLYTSTDASDISNILGFQVDKVSAGGGSIGIPRAIFGFFTTTLPKIVFWDYQFLQPPLELIRWVLIMSFGAPVMIVFIQNFVGVVRGYWNR